MLFRWDSAEHTTMQDLDLIFKQLETLYNHTDQKNCYLTEQKQKILSVNSGFLFISNTSLFHYSPCKNACLFNKVSSSSTWLSSGTQQSTGHTAAH
jgi:hypothetical protein